MTGSHDFDDWSFGVIDQVNDPHNTEQKPEKVRSRCESQSLSEPQHRHNDCLAFAVLSRGNTSHPVRRQLSLELS